MRDYNYYLSKAKEAQGYTYDNQIDEALGFKGAMTTLIKKGKRHLSDESMAKLAELGNQDVETALMDLNFMRAPDAVKARYASILQKITHTTATIALLLGATLVSAPSHAADFSKTESASLYIMEKKGLFSLIYRFIKRFQFIVFTRF